MSPLQKLQVRQSEIREKLNTLLGNDKRSEEQDAELVKLTTEGQKIEPEIRAAIIAAPDPEEAETVETGDAESRELRQLTGRANAGAIILAVTEKRNSIGAELELQQHHKLAENQLPLDLLRVEQRAAGVTTARRTSEPTRRRSCNPFSQAAQERSLELLARPWPQAMLCTRSWRLARMLEDHTPTHLTYRKRTARSTPTSWPLSVSKPAPCTAALTPHVPEHGFGAEDGAQLRPHRKTRLRGPARRRGTTHRIEARESQQVGRDDPRPVSLAVLFGRVDGRFAAEQGDLKVLMGAGTYGHAGSTYQTNPHMSALDALMEKIPVRVSAHIPAVASTKQNNVIRLGMRSDYVQPTWNNITIIVDETSGSGKARSK